MMMMAIIVGDNLSSIMQGARRKITCIHWRVNLTPPNVLRTLLRWLNIELRSDTGGDAQSESISSIINSILYCTIYASWGSALQVGRTCTASIDSMGASLRVDV